MPFQTFQELPLPRVLQYKSTFMSEIRQGFSILEYQICIDLLFHSGYNSFLDTGIKIGIFFFFKLMVYFLLKVGLLGKGRNVITKNLGRSPTFKLWGSILECP